MSIGRGGMRRERRRYDSWIWRGAGMGMRMMRKKRSMGMRIMILGRTNISCWHIACG